jgi:hypothetical protein
VIASYRGGTHFTVTIDVDNQDAGGRYDYTDAVRLCSRSWCDRWISEATDGVPSHVAVSTLPFFVTVGHGIAASWRAGRTPVWVEWRYTQRQTGTSEARTTIKVATGQAALALR